MIIPSLLDVGDNSQNEDNDDADKENLLLLDYKNDATVVDFDNVIDNGDDNSSENHTNDDCGNAKRIVFVISSPSILEMFSRLCGLTNCITWGLSQVKPFDL